MLSGILAECFLSVRGVNDGDRNNVLLRCPMCLIVSMTNVNTVNCGCKLKCNYPRCTPES